MVATRPGFATFSLKIHSYHHRISQINSFEVGLSLWVAITKLQTMLLYVIVCCLACTILHLRMTLHRKHTETSHIIKGARWTQYHVAIAQLFNSTDGQPRMRPATRTAELSARYATMIQSRETCALRQIWSRPTGVLQSFSGVAGFKLVLLPRFETVIRWDCRKVLGARSGPFWPYKTYGAMGIYGNLYALSTAVAPWCLTLS